MESCLSKAVPGTSQCVPRGGAAHSPFFRPSPLPVSLPLARTLPRQRRSTQVAASQLPCRPLSSRPASQGGAGAVRGRWSHVCGVTVVGRNEEVPVDGEECEVVHGADVVLGQGPFGSPTTPVKADDAHKFKGYMVVPLKNRNRTGVLLLPDVMGCTCKENREFAHRLACFGYTILLPDLFRGMPWDDSMRKDEYEQWRAMHANPARRVAQDIDTAAAYLKAHMQQADDLDAASAPSLAIMGFCFGGGRVLETLARDGRDGNARFATGVSFYGTRFDADAVAQDIKVPVLMIVGEEDELCPVADFSKVGDRVQGSEVLVYPERGHAFVHRPASMEEDDDAENAFQVARHWLHKHLLMDDSLN